VNVPNDQGNIPVTIVTAFVAASYHLVVAAAAAVVVAAVVVAAVTAIATAELVVESVETHQADVNL
jgi:hypothetical protein